MHFAHFREKVNKKVAPSEADTQAIYLQDIVKMDVASRAPKLSFGTASNRGLAPRDERFFAVRQLPVLRIAAADLCRLLDRGYMQRLALESLATGII